MLTSNFKYIYHVIKVFTYWILLGTIANTSFLKEERKKQIRKTSRNLSHPKLLLFDIRTLIRILKYIISSLFLRTLESIPFFNQRKANQLRILKDGDQLMSGHTINLIVGEEEARLKKYYTMYKEGVMRANPGGWIFPSKFIKYADLIYNYKFKQSDILVMTYPKSGTTWVQEIVWNLVYNPNLDSFRANVPLDTKFPNIDADTYLDTSGPLKLSSEAMEVRLFNLLFPGRDWSEGINVKLAEFLPYPRTMKCHLPLCFLPPNILDTCKVCYVARDPRDVMSSLYHFSRLHKLINFTGQLDDFVDCVIREENMSAPYWSHLKLAWNMRQHPNMCFLFYEDLKNNIEGQIRRIDTFLGTNRTDKQIQNIINYTSFSQMKERLGCITPTSHEGKFFNQEFAEKEGGFFRKGVSGDWQNRFTSNQIEKLNAWMSKNLEEFGEDFKFKV